jgi:hypothetical protein
MIEYSCSRSKTIFHLQKGLIIICLLLAASSCVPASNPYRTSPSTSTMVINAQETTSGNASPSENFIFSFPTVDASQGYCFEEKEEKGAKSYEVFKKK